MRGEGTQPFEADSPNLPVGLNESYVRKPGLAAAGRSLESEIAKVPLGNVGGAFAFLPQPKTLRRWRWRGSRLRNLPA